MAAPPGPGSARRRWRWALLALAAVLIGAFAGADVAVLPAPEREVSSAPVERTPQTGLPDHPDARDPRVAPIAAWVAEERELEFAREEFDAAMAACT